MKRIKTLIITICMVFTATCFTTAANNTEYYYEDKDITVSFSSDCELSYEKKQAIADKLVYAPLTDDQISTYSWCWLLGHDLTGNTVVAIEHKVDDTEPRCLKRVYDVDVCSNCDYIKETLASTIYIFCCPEE